MASTSSSAACSANAQPTPHSGSEAIAASPTSATPGADARRVTFGIETLPMIGDTARPRARSGPSGRPSKARSKLPCMSALNSGRRACEGITHSTVMPSSFGNA